MTDFTTARSHIYVSGANIYASYHTDNENNIYSAHNAAMNATTGHTHSGTAGDGPTIPALAGLTGDVVGTDDTQVLSNKSFSDSVSIDVDLTVLGKELIGTSMASSFSVSPSLEVSKAASGFTGSMAVGSRYNDAQSSRFYFLKDRGDGVAGQSNDDIGEIDWLSNDNAGNPQLYAYIFSEIINSTAGAEKGALHFGVVRSGTMFNYLSLAKHDSYGSINFFPDAAPGGIDFAYESTSELSINVGPTADVDGCVLYLNNHGYNNGSTRFRDTAICDGKGTAIARVDGADGNLVVGKGSPPTSAIGSLEIRQNGNTAADGVGCYDGIGAHSSFRYFVDASNEVNFTRGATTYWKMNAAGALQLPAASTPTANFAYRQSMAKAYGNISFSAAIIGSFNVTSCVKYDTGKYRVTLTTPFTDASYTVCAVAISSVATFCTANTVSTNTFDVACFDYSGTKNDVGFMFSAFGDQ